MRLSLCVMARRREVASLGPVKPTYLAHAPPGGASTRPNGAIGMRAPAP